MGDGARMKRGGTVEMTSGLVGREQAIVDLFTATFAASEGAAEGALIGGLVRDLLAGTPGGDIRVFWAQEDGRIVGAAVFTRLAYAQDPRSVVLLSPMAVAADRQRRGIGQTLIDHALGALRAAGVEIAITYGDPDYYRQVGFRPITEDQARAPLPLSQPHGWIGQSLTGGPMPDLEGEATCVAALDRADIW